MKSKLIFLFLICSVLVSAQLNKFSDGDLGIKYGVAFNGALAQTIAFSGIIAGNWELGAGINVSFADSRSNNIGSPYDVNTIGGVIQLTNTSITINRTINSSVIPYLLYHFPVKSNLDVYAGPNLNIGTGSITLYNSSDNITSGSDYYSERKSSSKIPFGYQLGAGVIAGCQYFFYKKLALGFEANLAAVVTGNNGQEKIGSQEINYGSNNSNNTNYSNVTYNHINTYALSIKSGSSAAVFLTFFFSKKTKPLVEGTGNF